MTVSCSAAVNSSSGGFPNRPGWLEPQTAQWGVRQFQVGGSVVRIPNNVRKLLNLNFGGSGDFPNFLFQDTIYFGILLTSLHYDRETLEFTWGFPTPSQKK
jgi:hypothetical protein